jgi:hypothetical protein
MILNGRHHLTSITNNCENLGILYGESLSAFINQQEAITMTNTFRIIKKSTAPKLSPRAKGSLTYHIGYNNNSKSFHVRITANSGGFFSNEWISLSDILDTIEATNSSKPFKAIIFKSLYQPKGSNNHGFLAAALRAEKLLLPVEKQLMSHTLGDAKGFKAAMQQLIKDKVSLEDDVAEAEKIKEAKRAELVAAMKASSKKKPTSK